jgi:hypothetical protein
MIAPPATNWHEANQRHLMAAVAEVRSRLERLIGGESTPEESDAAEFAELPPPALDSLCEAFGLTGFERRLLLLCAGMELDSRFRALLAQTRSATGCNSPTFGVALSIFEDAHWSALTAARPLRRWRVIEVGPGDTLATSPLRIAERVLHYLAGVPAFDEYLHGLVAPAPAPAILPETYQTIAVRMNAIWARPDEASRLPLIELRGADAESIRQIATVAAGQAGFRLYVLPSRNVPATASDTDAFARLWRRETILNPVGLLVELGVAEGSEAANAAALLEPLEGLVIVSTAIPRPLSTRHPVLIPVDRPTSGEQRQIWRGLLEDVGIDADAVAERLGTQFDLGGGSIRSAAAQVLTDRAITSGDVEDELWMACRRQARARLDRVAQRIESASQSDDLVLPASQKALLRTIEVHVRRRATVYSDWGFAEKGSRGLGISALFAGPSGVGKTMASEILANRLKLDLYRVDLSQVVSKYIGETEKNLGRVFDAAEESSAVLLFDEADALFGKRTEVKDSHDRYANIEVSYLLQRMETYRGLAILTTNRKRALDQAFLRRIRFVVEFPFPEYSQRLELWQRVFPPRTPTCNLRFEALARLNAAGGNIRNIAMGAAFLAADADEPVGMKHVLSATRAEFAKMETPLTELEVAGWHDE